MPPREYRTLTCLMSERVIRLSDKNHFDEELSLVRSGYNIGCIMIMDMTTILLKTKLDIPPARSKQVSRPRLFERLDAGVQRKMTLISAPAGSGKTTLISSWVREHAIPTAWFSVDKDDNDPARFWIYFAAGLQTVEGSLGREIQSVLSSSQSPSYNALLTGLINEIGGIKGQLVLVLDDFHLIENDQIQQTMMFFYDYMPPTLHVILSTRADPPWPLARMRAKGEMTEFRNDDLCFTFEEAGEFLSETMGIALPHQSVAALREKMEGWIAGLQIAVLSIQNSEEKTGFIETFTGSHRFILDYLLEDVLENRPQETVQFLLKTSALDRMTAALCDAVTGKSNSQLVLIQLEKANLFLVALDDERRWYRYHHIFSDILRLRLQQLLPNEIAGIYQMASEWCERQNLLTEAIKYALEANDFDRAAYLIEANAFEMIRQAQLSTVVAWMKSLSDDIIQSRPWLSIAYAWVLAYSGHLAGIETIISRVETALVGVDPEKDKPDLVSNKNHLIGHIAAIRGYYALLYARDAVTAIQQSRKALAMLPEDDLRTRGFAKFVECVGLGVGGNLKKSESAFYEAINSEPACQDIFRKITLLSELAQVLRARGLLHRSSATCQYALQLADDYTQQSGRILLKVGFTYSYLSSVLQEWNQNENAAQYALKAVEYGERWGEIDCLILGYQRLAPALLAIGKIKEAFHAIYKAKQAVQNLSGGYKNITTTVETELYLLLGNVEQAAKCLMRSNWISKMK